MFISTVAETLSKTAKLTMVRLGNRTYRAWRIPKLTPMVRLGNRTYRAWGVLELPD